MALSEDRGSVNLKGEQQKSTKLKNTEKTDWAEKTEESPRDVWCCNKRFHSCVDESQKEKRKQEAENFPNMAEDLLHRLKKLSELTK